MIYHKKQIINTTKGEAKILSFSLFNSLICVRFLESGKVEWIERSIILPTRS